jgi:hypothetical protein
MNTLTNILADFEQDLTYYEGIYRILDFSLILSNTTYSNIKMDNLDTEWVFLKKDQASDFLKLSVSDYERAMHPEGEFRTIVIGLFVAQIYNLWEDKYRSVIAAQQCPPKSKEEFKNDFFGDLGKLRRRITHCNFAHGKDLEKIKSFSFLNDDEMIKIRESDFEKILELVRDELKKFKKNEKPTPCTPKLPG